MSADKPNAEENISVPEKDVAYWMSCSPEERISEMERLRMIAYPGYDPATSRMERVIKIVHMNDIRESK